MSRLPALFPTIPAHLRAASPDHPVLYFAPSVLQATAGRFRAGFDGLVTYAVKANDAPEVLENLVAAGLTAFDVASPDEMAKVRAVLPTAVLHYNNPVRSQSEISEARGFGVRSWSVDDLGELEKLGPGRGDEASIRLKLPVRGAAYDFGAKFGADAAQAVTLLRAAVDRGFRPSMTFHPGTQCADPAAWASYIATCAEVARTAGVTLYRLNVGGGFAAHRNGQAPDLEAIFARISSATAAAFPDGAPALVCEPGRAMVAEAFSLGTRIKALRRDGSVFLNDGIYGGLAEAPILGNTDRIVTLSPNGVPRCGSPRPHT
ncbi:MAG: type III PLP-dependent enzyme, partial [Rhodobacteraceae bacterium]|nr:type III PLP-dependent enzyme [Paracoccaceae bacterium]